MATDTPAVSIAADAGVHFGAGLFFSVLDYATAKLSRRKAERIEFMRNCLIAIDLILGARDRAASIASGDATGADAAQTAEAPGPDSVQYGLNIAAIKEYLFASGLVKETADLKTRIAGFFRNEKLNALTLLQKVYFTLAAETLDTFFGMGYYSQLLQKGPIGSFMLNMYQMPLFLAGLYAGKYLVRNPVEWFTTMGEERKLAKAIEQAARATPIVDIVVRYTPVEQVARELDAQGVRFTAAKLTGRGRDVYKRLQRLAGGAASGVGVAAKAVQDRVAGYSREQARKDDARRNESKSRFDELTKGR